MSLTAASPLSLGLVPMFSGPFLLPHSPHSLEPWGNEWETENFEETNTEVAFQRSFYPFSVAVEKVVVVAYSSD